MRDIPNKNPGDEFFAAECTDMFSEEENLITDTGITLSAADLRQMSKSVANYVSRGDYYTDSGTANAYVLSKIGSIQAPTGYQLGMRVRFEPTNTSTGPSTVNVASLGVKTIVDSLGQPLVGSEILANSEIELTYDGTNFRLTSGAHHVNSVTASQKFIDCLLVNNSTDPNKDIDFGAGYFRADNANVVIHNPSTIVKRSDAAWAAGTNNGGMAASPVPPTSAWRHAFYIVKEDGTVDAGWDDNVSATNLLAAATGYTYYARRTSQYWNASSNIELFYMAGDTIWHNTTASAHEIPTITTTPTVRVVHVPLGVEVEAFLFIVMDAGGGTTNADHYSQLAGNFSINTNTTVNTTSFASRTSINLMTNTSGQVTNFYAGVAPAVYRLQTLGYREFYK